MRSTLLSASDRLTLLFPSGMEVTVATPFLERFCFYAERAVALFAEVVVIFEIASKALKALLSVFKTAW